MKLMAYRGFRFQGIEYAKDYPYRECTKDEIKILKKVPLSMCEIMDKDGILINKPKKRKEAQDVHSNNRSSKGKSSRKRR